MNTVKAFVAALLVTVASAFGQATFSVADVHSVPSGNNPVLAGILAGTSRFELHGATMVDLIRLAWDVPANRVAGGPNWLATDRFDVIATTPGHATKDEAAIMLRALLAERFTLVVHNDTRPITAFAMTVARGGAKMKKSEGVGDAGCSQNNAGGAQDGPAWNAYSCHAMTMAAFADRLPSIAPFYFLGNVAVDQTRLAGAWDFTFRFTSGGQAGAVESVALFDALEKQLGLHVASAKVPLPVIVVDSVNQKPTDNAPGVSENLKTRESEFEVALLKPSAPGATQMRISLQGGKVDLQNAPLRTLITVSWNLTNDKIIGLPDFADTDRYDIKATPPAGVDSGIDSLRVMMQGLLKSRFGMTMHNEDRPVEVYALVASKPKLKKAEPGNRADCQNAASTSAALLRSIACQNTTMEQFAAALKRMAGGYFSQRAVVDATGLDGAWDMTLNFSPAGAVQGAGGRGGNAAGDAALPQDPDGTLSIFDALERQLGLKLETQKRALPVLVIDHMEKKPAEN